MNRDESKDKIIALNYLGLLSIAGFDAKKFLQGQLTCNMEDITANQSRLGACCNPQGRVISFFRILWFKNQYLLVMPKDSIPILIAALKKYAVFFKVTLTDASHLFNLLGLLDTKDYVLKNVNETLEINPGFLIKIDINPNRYLLLKENKSPESEPTDKEELWKYYEIQSGIPAIYPETSEKFLPHELNLPLLNAVSFNKGCYIGQEIIARMEYKAKLKKKMVLARIQSREKPIRYGEIVQDNEICGNIIDFCQIGYNEWNLLVLVPTEMGHKSVALGTNQHILLNFK